ncbi:MAG TPA: CHAT domain-containing protein [Candidatus Elarobacter sp.]|nr:CHAT domain-containing protein [Candidatus Elarobacter sp.]
MERLPLVLELDDFADAHRWRWNLTQDGSLIAHHDVALVERSREYKSLVDLPGFLRYYAAPDDPETDAHRLMAESGDWIARDVLGAVASAIAARAPVLVLVLMPPEAADLLSLPLEIARVDGRTLRDRAVQFVFDLRATDRPAAGSPRAGALRVLAVFSLPPTSSALNLRRERQELRALVNGLSEQSRDGKRRAVDLRILQYGATRESLGAALEEPEGWEVVHFSGHGVPGRLILERADGSADFVTAADAVSLLKRARHSIKLVTISACLSAAGDIDVARGRLGLSRLTRPQPPVPTARMTPSLAQAILHEFRCPVIAMRFAVTDESAIAFAAALYRLLFAKGLPLDRAFAASAGAAARCAPQDPLSGNAATLLGRAAIGMRLVPPRTETQASVRLPWFPGEAEYLVGRVAAMTRASAVLSRGSRKTSVILHGMAGCGKTSCAVEIAHHFASLQRFTGFVWYSVPVPRGGVVVPAQNFIAAFHLQLGDILPPLPLEGLVPEMAEWMEILRALANALVETPALVVVDNLDAVLNEAGEYVDEAWRSIGTMLAGIRGASRLIITSRVIPKIVGELVETIAIHSLTLDEALLLAGELPNLRGLLRGSPADAALLRRALRLVQGHPKLMELVDSVAADRTLLADKLMCLEREHADPRLDVFFETGKSLLDGREFLREVQDWAVAALALLHHRAQRLFRLLCILEEPDRTAAVIRVASKYERQDDGEADDILDDLSAIARCGLAEVRGVPSPDEFEVFIHPAIAEAGLAETDASMRDGVTRWMAAFWAMVSNLSFQNLGRTTGGGTLTRNAGIAAFPYLERLGDWESAAWLLQRVLAADDSLGLARAVQPLLRIIVQHSDAAPWAPVAIGTLSTVLARTGAVEDGAALLRDVVDRALACGDAATAVTALLQLFTVLLRAGRFADARAVLQQARAYAPPSDEDTWDRIALDAFQLQLEAFSRDDHTATLNEVDALVDRMEATDPGSTVHSLMSWNIREAVLSAGLSIALAADDAARALNFSRHLAESMRRRGAPDEDRVRVMLGEALACTRLGHFEEAAVLLVECRTLAEAENNIPLLIEIASALGDLEFERGAPRDALAFWRSALRWEYTEADVQHLLRRHYRISREMGLAGEDRTTAVAHAMAGALIATVSGTDLGPLETLLAVFFRHVGSGGLGVVWPDDFDRLCAALDGEVGPRFREVVTAFEPSATTVNETLRAVTERIRRIVL